MQINHKKLKLYLPLVISLTLIAGILLGISLDRNRKGTKTYVYSHPQKINKVINYIQKNYVDSVSEKKLVETAIPAMLKELDPHSVYIPARELKKVNEPLRGNFDGIGIQFRMRNDTVVVISTISGGPSEMVGLQPGDRIVQVNDTVIAGVEMSTSDIVGMLKGKRGTKVNVTIKRNNAPELLHFTITRDKIPLYSVDISYMINESTGYVKIDRFAKNTHKEFTQAVNKLIRDSVQKIIVDLRGNNGGFLNAATRITDEFLKDKKLIVYTKGRKSPRQEIYASSEGICQDMEVAVIIDEWSASASEILAGAIQDNDRGIIVGRRSFGKGLVQEQTVLPDKSAIRLTVARYYTPTGRCIQKPYENGRKQYYNDLSERLKHGEFFEADSIDLADSLKYKTPEGDVVYGGGGIMPDFFVPVDTTHHSPFFHEVTNKGLIYNYAFDYADENRKILESYTTPQELKQHLKTTPVYDRFLEFAFEKGIPKQIKGIEKSRKVIDTRLKAYIARNIMDNEGFYPIIREVDKTLQKAIDLLADMPEKEKYAKAE